MHNQSVRRMSIVSVLPYCTGFGWRSDGVCLMYTSSYADAVESAPEGWTARDTMIMSTI